MAQAIVKLGIWRDTADGVSVCLCVPPRGISRLLINKRRESSSCMPSRRKNSRRSRQVKRQRLHVKSPRKPKAHLLIIECDSQNLAASGLNLGTPFGQALKTAFPKKRIALVQTSCEQKLVQDLADVFQQYGCFRAILIVGHSNETGLALTSDGQRCWSAVGSWFNKFEPELVFRRHATPASPTAFAMSSARSRRSVRYTRLPVRSMESRLHRWQFSSPCCLSTAALTRMTRTNCGY